jgi:hypothetical protein
VDIATARQIKGLVENVIIGSGACRVFGYGHSSGNKALSARGKVEIMRLDRGRDGRWVALHMELSA